jgi:hypothetical protein
MSLQEGYLPPSNFSSRRRRYLHKLFVQTFKMEGCFTLVQAAGFEAGTPTSLTASSCHRFQMLSGL